MAPQNLNTSTVARSSYATGDPDSPVAICTLSSFTLFDRLVGSPLAGRVAIIGALETENIGLERMLVTLLQRPRIRWLVLCGEEQRGRYQAQAVQALFADGLDEAGAIRGARSKRARLQRLTTAHVDALRRQVRLCNLVGIQDPDIIASGVDRCGADDPGAFDEAVELDDLPEPIPVARKPYRLEEHDPRGFFVVLLDRPGRQILVEHYIGEGDLAHRIVGPDAESLCSALIEWGLLSRLDHAAYMGRELAKAETALQRGLTYRQDDPL